MKTLYFIYYIISHSVYDQLLPYLKKKCQKLWQNIRKMFFLNSSPIFLDLAPSTISFSISEDNLHQVRWRTFSEDPSLHHSLLYYIKLWSALKIFSNFRGSFLKFQRYAIIWLYGCFSYLRETFQEIQFLWRSLFFNSC